MENPRIRKRLARERKMRALLILVVLWAVFLSIYNPYIKDIAAVRVHGTTWKKSLDLSGGVTITQEFNYDYDGFKGLKFWVAETKSVKANILITLAEKGSKELIFKKTVSSSSICDNNHSYSLSFDEQKKSAGKTYVLKIKNTAESGSGLFVRLDDKTKATKLAFRDERVAHGSVMMNTFFCDDTVRRIYLIMWGLIIMLSLLCTILVGDEWHKNFLVLGITLGLIFSIFHTFPHVLDESTHYFRSFAIAQGHWHDQMNSKEKIGAELSANYNTIINTEFSVLNWYANPEIFNQSYESNRTFIVNPYMSSVIPIDHAVASLGILIGILLNLPAWAVIILARLTDLIFYIVLVYFAIKTAPYYKSVLFGCSLMPACLFLSGSCTQDAVLIGACILYIGMMISWIFDENKVIGVKDMIALILVFSLIASIKYLIYAPVLLLLIFASRKKYRVPFGKLIMFCALTAVMVLLFRYQTALLELFPFTEDRNGNVNVAEQIKFVFSNPYLTYRNFGSFFLDNFVSDMMRLAWYTPAAVGYIAGIWVIVGSVFCQDKYLFKNRKKSAIFHTTAVFIVLVVFLLIMGALYVGFTPVGQERIDGVQSRYLLPILPLVCIALTKLPVDGNIRYYESRYAYTMIAINFLGAAYTCLYA